MNLSVIVSPALALLAQTTQSATQSAAAASTQPAKPPGWADALFGNMMFPLLLAIIVMYVFIFRSKRNQERKVKEARDALKRGDRVQTIGGILGSVVQVEETKVLLKVDESSNTKIWFSRNAIHRVLTEEKVEAAK